MNARPFLYALTSAGLITGANGAAVILVGTGNGALVANGTTKIDITDPENDSLISTTEWGTAPTVVGPGTVGTFNGPGNNGETWAKIFDNFIGGPGPWGASTSKICCSFNPGATSVTVTSSVTRYSLSGYAIANGNDSPNRRPTGWRLFGSNDGFASENVLLDTVVPADINGGAGWTQNNEVGEVTLSSATDFYSSFRVIWDTSVGGTDFQVGELELIGTAIPEPSAFALLGLAGLALTARRRR